jgi:hypothetical protein
MNSNELLNVATNQYCQVWYLYAVVMRSRRVLYFVPSATVSYILSEQYYEGTYPGQRDLRRMSGLSHVVVVWHLKIRPVQRLLALCLCCHDWRRYREPVPRRLLLLLSSQAVMLAQVELLRTSR